MSTVIQIVTAYLTAGGFDGLCCEGCGCELADLAPCGEGMGCQPAYRGADKCEPGEWAMYSSKEAAEASLVAKDKP